MIFMFEKENASHLLSSLSEEGSNSIWERLGWSKVNPLNRTSKDFMFRCAPIESLVPRGPRWRTRPKLYLFPLCFFTNISGFMSSFGLALCWHKALSVCLVCLQQHNPRKSIWEIGMIKISPLARILTMFMLRWLSTNHNRQLISLGSALTRCAAPALTGLSGPLRGHCTSFYVEIEHVL